MREIRLNRDIKIAFRVIFYKTKTILKVIKNRFQIRILQLRWQLLPGNGHFANCNFSLKD